MRESPSDDDQEIFRWPSRAPAIYQEIEARLGEANARKALGDLYVRTSRLKEAENAYQTALPIYQEIEARLGEANTLQAVATLLMKRGAPDQAFDRLLAVQRLHEAAENRLGAGGTRGYLARAAAAAGRPVRAVVLGWEAFRALAAIESRFGQMLALDDLVQSLAAVEQESGVLAAVHLSWALAASMDHPSAAGRATLLDKLLPGFTPGDGFTEEQEREALAAVEAAVRSCEEQLAAADEDPYSPLGESSRSNAPSTRRRGSGASRSSTSSIRACLAWPFCCSISIRSSRSAICPVWPDGAPKRCSAP